MKTLSKPRRFTHGDRIKHKCRGLGVFRCYTPDPYSCLVTFDQSPSDCEEVSIALVESSKAKGIIKL